MNHRTVRSIFIAVLIFLPLQYAIVGIVGYYHSEPWPAFVFPGFKNVFVYDDGFEIEQTRFEVYNESASEPKILMPQELFPGIPLSQIPGFMRTHFHDPGSVQAFSAEGRQWLREHSRAATGFEPRSMDIVKIREYYTHRAEGAVIDSTTELKRISILFAGR